MRGKPIIEIENLFHTYMKGTPMEHVALKGTNMVVNEGNVLPLSVTLALGNQPSSSILMG